MVNLIWKIISGIIATGLAVHFVDGVVYNGEWKTIIAVGFVLGLLTFFIKPILEKITFPLRIITLNLFTIVIIMGLIWLIDCFFPATQFEIAGLNALFFYSLIVWGLEILMPAK